MSRERREILVAGGGMAGLTAALHLVDAGLDVEVLEARDQAGGNVQTETVDGFQMEKGPHTFLASALGIFDLATRTGVQDRLVTPMSGARFIARSGRLHQAPTGPWSFITTGLLSWKAKLTLATEPFRLAKGDPSDSAATFFERRFGTEAARVIAGAFISGVYAGDPEQLSAAAAFPLFWGFEQEAGSMIRGALRYKRRQPKGPKRKGLYSFDRGLGVLSKAAVQALGGRVSTGERVVSVVPSPHGYMVHTDRGTREARAVVLATPPGDAARILHDTDPRLADLLGGIPMAPIAVVHLGFSRRCPDIPDGFGFLAPRGEGVRTLGVLFPSRLFPGRAPEGGDLLTAFVGGSTDPEALDLSDQDLVDLVQADLRHLTGHGETPDFTMVRRHPVAIPQMVHGHLERMAEVQERLGALPGMVLAGNYLHGVGLKDAVASGREAAQRLAELLRGGGAPREEVA